MRAYRRLSRALLLVGALLLNAANPTQASTRKFSGTGIVLAVNRTAGAISVSHEKIPGYMDAMAMSFHVRDLKLVENLEAGQRVYFRLVVSAQASYIDYVKVISAARVDPSKWQAPVASRLIATGDVVPGFTLVDQNNEPVALSQFLGKVVVINFIYTRCPLPDYCPRMTNNFVDIRKRFANRLGRDLVLLTITIDPQYDTPQVLNNYARAFGAGASQGWHFLSGNKQDIAIVSGDFGMEYWPDAGMITHNLQTPIIDRHGRLAANVEGKNYSARQLGDLIERVLEKGE